MKCKNWSNKINNFVVSQLKAFKINGQQQVIPTMPAMPKEKTTPVPLNESNFTEMKIKEQLVGGCGGVNIVGISCTPSKSSSSSTNDLLLTSTTNDIDTTAAGTTNFITYRGDNKMANNLTSSMANTTGNLNNYNNSELNNSITSIKSATIPSSSSTPIAATATTTTTATSSSINNINVANDGVSITPSTVTSSPPTTTTTTPRPSGPVKKSAQDYIFGRYIGEGSFSTVYLARDIYTGKNYAIKVCDKQHILREKKQEYIRREREIMHIMNNVPGFVNLTCTFQDTRSLYFVMTYAKNGDLLPYINKVGSFDLDCTRHYAAELVIAIENMHKRNVVHRDLKPENILLDENMHTLIADFGSAKVLSTDYQQSSSSSAVQTETADTTTGTTTITTTTSTSSSPASSNNDCENSSRQHHHHHHHHPHNQRQQQQHNHSNYHNNKNSQQQQQQQHQSRRRRGSFVGTAQYVSPEVLQGDTITKAADLWALGCIIYQMISGLPPFRGGSDYLIFKEIMNLNLVFPEGFDKDAEDLVRNLIKIHPEERIGAQDKCGRYESIRTHKFFHGINWETVQIQTPPPIYPYLPGVHKDDELRSHYRVPDNLEPGLDDKQLTRLLGLELGTVTSIDFEKKTEPKKNILNISEIEKQRRLEQQKTDRWNQFVDGEIIIKKGYINKRKGLFARKRMLLLTTGPRLIYVDPVQMVKKGEIPWGPELRVEPKNFKIFFVHTTNPKKLTSTSSFSTIKSLLHPTFKSWSKQDENNQLYLCLQPNRTYYLEDPEGFALEWVEAIEDVRQKTYKS